VAVVLIAFVYVCSSSSQRSYGTTAISAWRAGTFLTGLLLIWIALGSPLAALDHEWLTVHMIQHLPLMTLGPPLL
jgi:putative membrane protein